MMVMFHKPEHYPAKGVSVPYLFGHVEREQMLRDKRSSVNYALHHEGYSKVIHYFDGVMLHRIDAPHARILIGRYIDDVWASWNKRRTVLTVA